MDRPATSRATDDEEVSPMAKRFELHLEGMDVPEGLIDADRLVEIVKSLQEMATRLGRFETDSATRGRPNKNLDRVASLRIGLEKGSTTIVAERGIADGAFEIDLPDEEEVDRKFEELIEGIGADQRPSWVPDTVARAADDFVNALQRTAPSVEIRIDGVSKKTFETKAIHRETWKPHAVSRPDDAVTFTGRLFAVNLKTHRLQVQDDVGNEVGLPRMLNDAEIGPLVGSYVTVAGAPEFDAHGKLINIKEASVARAPDPFDHQPIGPSQSLDEILASAPGPRLGGIPGLTDAELDDFLEAIG
jgi:hypothetical protein